MSSVPNSYDDVSEVPVTTHVQLWGSTNHFWTCLDLHMLQILVTAHVLHSSFTCASRRNNCQWSTNENYFDSHAVPRLLSPYDSIICLAKLSPWDFSQHFSTLPSYPSTLPLSINHHWFMLSYEVYRPVSKRKLLDNFRLRLNSCNFNHLSITCLEAYLLLLTRAFKSSQHHFLYLTGLCLSTEFEDLTQQVVRLVIVS